MRYSYFVLFTILLVNFILQSAIAQQVDNKIYIPDTLVKSSPDRLNKIKLKLDSELKDIAEKPKNQREYIENRYKNRYEYFKSSIEGGDFIIGGEIESYLQKILKEVLSANASLSSDIQVFVSRSTVPNAFSTGDNNIVFNVGLLNKTSNDAQVAFVMCHELAHQYLEHTKKSLFAKAEKYTSKEFVKSLNKTLKEEYNVKKKLEDLVMPSLVSDMRFSREDELQADSLGFIFLSNTRFEKKGAVQVIELLDSIDLYYDRQPLALSSVINCKDYPYQSRWEPEAPKSSLQIINDEKSSLEDSLKTHPDCKIRKERMSVFLKSKEDKKGGFYLIDSLFSRRIRLQAESENAFTMFLWENMGRMMFYAYHSSLEFPEDYYSRILLSFGFSRLNQLQRTHKVNTEFPLPVKDYEVNYNKMLNFLNNLNREESSSLGYFIVRPVNDSLKKYDDYLAALTYSAYVYNKKDEFLSLKNEYIKSFPKGRFTSLITDLNFNSNQTINK